MKPRSMLFFAADDAIGSTGGTALAEPIQPAASDTFNVKDYAPKSASDVENEIYAGADLPQTSAPAPAPPKNPTPQEKPQGKTAAKAPTKADPAAPEQKPPAPDAPKQPDIDPAKAPVAQLRSAYETTKARLAELEQELTTLRTDHPEVKTLRSDLEAARKQAEDLRKAQDEYEKRLAFYSPEAASKIQEMGQKFNEEMGSRLAEIPGLPTTAYAPLVREFAALPHGKPEFQEAFAEFEQKLADQYGERKADRLIPLLARGRQHLIDVQKAQEELRNDSGRFMYERQAESWQKDASKLDDDLKGVLEVAPDIAERYPYHPVSAINHFMKEAPEQFNPVKEQLEKLVRLAFLPPKPRQKSDFPGMSEEQISQALAAEARQIADAKRVAARYVLQGGLAMFGLGPFFAQYKKMEERLKGDAQLPDPGSPTGATPPTGNPGVIDPRTYQAPAIDERELYR